LRALKRWCVTVQPFKCGPDYIDPAFHAAAAGRQCINLDTWAMRGELIENLIGGLAADADLCLAEGVMGLFDGAPERGQSGTGSTADLAALTGWPVVLVLDVCAQAETAAAVALGCRTYRNDVAIAGIILNLVASVRHETPVARSVERLGLPVFGALRRTVDIALPERYLGLVQAKETAVLDARLDRIAETVGAAVCLDRLVGAAGPLTMASDGSDSPSAAHPLPPPGQRIALAQDQAFSFIYPHLLAGWRQLGAEILPFSPLANEVPDTACDAIWLPGGYPELHGATLANATRFRAGVRSAAARGIPIHGECGGYMVLGAGIQTDDGKQHEMLGLLGLETTFAKRHLHLGYRRARIISPSRSATHRQELFGHEFHYATVIANRDQPFAQIEDANGVAIADQGSRRGSVTGTFFHVIDRAA
jgi:cobyrinic acid a,c-diamide synthase